MERIKKSLRGTGVLIVLGILALAEPSGALAATFLVNSQADAVDNNIGDGVCATAAAVCSLRAAVQEANALAGDDIISLPAGTYVLTGAAAEDAAATGDLDILAAGGGVTVTGAGAATTIIHGNNNDRIFQTQGAATLVISGVTLRNGSSGAQSGGAIATSGGAILTLNNVNMTNNASGVEGAAIDIAANAASAVTMNTVVIANNNSAAGGDIVANGAGATLSITNGTISGNNDTALSNKAGSTMTLTNVTVSGNAATGGGGAIDNLGTLNLNNATIAGNTGQAGAGNAGGIRNTGTVNIRNTIIASNTPVNCVPTAAFNSQGNNLDSGASCGLAGAGDVSSTDPLLNALADNGGSLQTHALQPTSPAIDAGSVIALCAQGGVNATDARGIARPVDGDANGTATCDKGAFEFRPRKVTTSPVSLNFGTVTSGTTFDQVVTVTNGGDGPLTLGVVASVNPLAAPFTLPANACSSAVLARAQSCAITVRFLPISTTIATDSFDIPSDDPLTPSLAFSVSGSGTATLAPHITVTDSIAPTNDLRVAFGSVAVGTTADATITLTGGGSAPGSIGTIASSNTVTAPFSILNDACSNQTIAPTATCTLTVRFAPVSNVSSSDTFDIPNNDPDTPVLTITLTGSGLSATGNTPPSVPVLSSPAEGEVVAGSAVTLVWQRSSDPDGDTVVYHVENCANASFTGCTPVDVASAGTGIMFAGLGGLGAGILVLGITAGSGLRRSRKMLLLMLAVLFTGALFMSCSGGGGGDSAPPPASTSISGLAPGTTYYWRVTADDGQGGTATSEVRTYRTQ